MTDYLTWCNRTKSLPWDSMGQSLESHNEVKVIALRSGEFLLQKEISNDVVYVPRLKILGEVAYSLLDWHLNPAERVTPNVCPVAPNRLWRQFIPGLPGESWRGDLYAEKKSLEAADLVIVDRILESRFAQRIALLDMIFLCQDRSARNWIEYENRFWAIDNGMLWPYAGRYADKEVIKTGKVDHLRPPMEALVSQDHIFNFQIGIFSSLYVGNLINDGLLMWLDQVDWGSFFLDLRKICRYPLGLPDTIIGDWRFDRVWQRAEWLLQKRRFPTVSEAYHGEWQEMIDRPDGAAEIWKREWEKC